MGVERSPNKGRVVVVWDSKKTNKHNFRQNLLGVLDDEDGAELETESMEKQLLDPEVSGDEQFLSDDEARKILLKGMDEQSHDELYLSRIAEPLLERLRSHKRGKPSLVYALIKRGIEESTKKKERDLAAIEAQIAAEKEALEKKNSQLKENQLKHETARNVSDELKGRKNTLEAKNRDLEIEIAALSKDSEALVGDVQRIEGEISAVVSENTEIEKALIAQRIRKEGVPKEPLEKFGPQKFSLDMSEKLRKETLEQARVTEQVNKQNEKMSELNSRKERLSSASGKIKQSLDSLANAVGVNDPEIIGAKKNSIGLFARLIRKFSREPSKFNVVSSGHIQSRDVDIFSNGEIREVNEGSEKSFTWDHSKNISDNLSRLLTEYSNSPGYHSKDRLYSAKKVLDKLAELADDPNRDQKIIDFIREQEIGSHGFRGVKSKLHSIYMEAELVHRSNLICVLNKRSEELKRIQDELTVVSSTNDSIESLAKITDERNIRKQGEMGGLQEKRENLREKAKELKNHIREDRSAMMKKRDRLALSRKQNLILRMQHRLGNMPSGKRTRTSDLGLSQEDLEYLRKELKVLDCDSLLAQLSDREARFLVTEFTRLDALNATSKKNDEYHFQLSDSTKEEAAIRAENDMVSGDVKIAYHEVQVISRRYEGQTLPKLTEVKKLDDIVTGISNLATVVKESSPTVASADTSSDELSSGSESESSESSPRHKTGWNPFE